MYNENVACGDHIPAEAAECLPVRSDPENPVKDTGSGTHSLMRIEPPLGEDNLSDYLLFQSVMGDAEACECVLSILLDEPDLKLKEVQVEKMISNERGKRSVRLDVLPVREGLCEIHL